MFIEKLKISIIIISINTDKYISEQTFSTCKFFNISLFHRHSSYKKAYISVEFTAFAWMLIKNLEYLHMQSVLTDTEILAQSIYIFFF